MYSLKDTIFEEFFAKFFTANDYNKDVNGKGFLQRYIETLAEDWDETVVKAALTLLDATLIPSTVKDKFVPYLEKMVGVEPIIADLAVRRRVLARIIEIYKCKGTLRSYQLIFNALGFDTVEILGAGIDFGFDSSITLDNEIRTFDLGKCHKCRYYRLNLVGAVVINSEMYEAIQNAIKIVEPIYCRLFDITLNSVEANVMDIFVQYNGDLVYSTLSEAQVGFSLASNGDLFIYGTDAGSYSLINGNLVYNG